MLLMIIVFQNNGFFCSFEQPSTKKAISYGKDGKALVLFYSENESFQRYQLWINVDNKMPKSKIENNLLGRITGFIYQGRSEEFSRMSTIHPGIFLGRALCVSPRMNTTASRDQFKPIRIGENLVVNYNLW